MEKEKLDLENFPTSNSARKMLSYVSDGFYDESYVGKWIYQVMGIEYDKALEMVEDLPAQFFPETATWGLMYHEVKWGLPVKDNLSYEERRKRIYEKRDCRAPMTPYKMEKYLQDATGFMVYVADINDPGKYGFIAPHPNVFKVIFYGDGTVDSRQAHELLDRIKQSHTVYTISQHIDFIIANLEKISLRHIQVAMKCHFWRTRYFDGSEIMNGSHLMDAMPAYDLRLGVNYGIKVTAKCQFALTGISARMAIPEKENIYMSEQAVLMAITIWRSLFLSESVLKVKTAVSAVSSVHEEFGNGTIRIQRHLAYFNGSLLMDGSHLMDSYIREEEI